MRSASRGAIILVEYISLHGPPEGSKKMLISNVLCLWAVLLLKICLTPTTWVRGFSPNRPASGASANLSHHAGRTPPSSPGGPASASALRVSSQFDADEIENEDWIPRQDESAKPPPHREWESELHFLVSKMLLEGMWREGFLGGSPRFLSYERAKHWAQAQNMWTSEAEWKEWIGMGEGKPSLIPSDPERTYGELGTWGGWDDFLGTRAAFSAIFDDDDAFL